MSKETLSADEIALYDRQIRLWGMSTQLRLRSAKVLVINFGGLGTEIVKNLVLGGLNLIEILDDSVIKEEDFASQFFLPNDDSIVGEVKLPFVVNNIKELNKRVTLSINTSSFGETLKDSSYFQQFEVIVATELSKQEIESLNELTRSFNIPLYVAGLHGMFGYIFSDLITHSSTAELEVGNQTRKPGTKLNRCKTIVKVGAIEGSEKEIVNIVDEYAPLKDVFNSKHLLSQLNKRQLKRLSAALPLIFSLLEFERPDPEDYVNKDKLQSFGSKYCEILGIPHRVLTEEYLDLFTRQAFTEFSPVASVLGGALVQDLIQYLGGKESPMNNVLILDSIRSEMPIYTL